MVWGHKEILCIQCRKWSTFKAQNCVVVLWQNLDPQPGPDSYRCDVIMRKLSVFVWMLMLSWCGVNAETDQVQGFWNGEVVNWWRGEMVKCWGGLSHNKWGSLFWIVFYFLFSCVAVVVIITFVVYFPASFLQLLVQHDDLNRFCVCVLHLWLLSTHFCNFFFCTFFKILSHAE